MYNRLDVIRSSANFTVALVAPTDSSILCSLRDVDSIINEVERQNKFTQDFFEPIGNVAASAYDTVVLLHNHNVPLDNLQGAYQDLFDIFSSVMVKFDNYVPDVLAIDSEAYNTMEFLCYDNSKLLKYIACYRDLNDLIGKMFDEISILELPIEIQL